MQPGTGRIRATYVPTTPATASWGKLPNRDTDPVAVVPSGAVVSFDALSHEGVLEDQGRDPRGYSGGFGVRAAHVLRDAVDIAAHDGPGPHVVTGPVAVRGAQPGDVLKVEVLELRLRVPYGVISNRHGKGALPGELPDAWDGDPHYRGYYNQGGNISVFTPVTSTDGALRGRLPEVRRGIPLAPFMGLMGVARDTSAVVDSVPPTVTGGNIDINDLGVGSTLWLPVQVPGRASSPVTRTWRRATARWRSPRWRGRCVPPSGLASSSQVGGRPASRSTATRSARPTGTGCRSG
jgi:acetamidase/formamidase